MSLIQFGGLGFMTWAVLVQLLMKKRISFYDRILIHEQMNEESFSGMVRLIIFVLKSTFLIESIGAVLLSFTFIPEFGLKKGIFYSIFHSVSAYCNAGFDILGEESLSKYSNSILVLLPIASLIILGGIGFNVFIDILKKKNYKKLRLHSKLVLTMTLILIVFPAIVIFLLEFNNPSTFMGKSLSYKSLSSFFQSITLRTAGFFSIDQSLLRESTSLFCILIMFIGGSPSGTAGGIKTTTFALVIMLSISEIKGFKDVEIFNRRIESNVVRKALTIFTISIIWILFVTFILSVIENKRIVDLLFETTSAFATVGLTRGITPRLSTIGKSLIIITMFIGRLGPMELAYAISKNKKIRSYKEANGNIMVG